MEYIYDTGEVTFLYKGTAAFEIENGYGKYEYDFFNINNAEAFNKLMRYYNRLLQRFAYVYDRLEIFKDNKKLSSNVKQAMKEHNANISLTIQDEGDSNEYRCIILNQEVSKDIYDTTCVYFYLDEDDWYNFLRKGKKYALNGYNSAAIEYFTRAIALKPNNENLYIFRAYTFLNNMDYDKAFYDCTKAIKLDPKFSIAYAVRARIYKENGDTERAKNDCAKALELEPDNELAQELLEELDLLSELEDLDLLPEDDILLSDESIGPKEAAGNTIDEEPKDDILLSDEELKDIFGDVGAEELARIKDIICNDKKGNR